MLREAAAEGRLGLDKLDQRLDATWAATVYADLVPIVVDLPGGLAAAGGTVPAVPARAPWAASDGVVGRHDASRR